MSFGRNLCAHVRRSVDLSLVRLVKRKVFECLREGFDERGFVDAAR